MYHIYWNYSFNINTAHRTILKRSNFKFSSYSNKCWDSSKLNYCFRKSNRWHYEQFHETIQNRRLEIQLEDSNFMTIPNLYIANNPLKLTRKKDPVISTSVSLGYNIPRTQIEESLKEAALLTGLTDPYVYITELGDFSVSYKIHGFLKDSNMYFSSISLLNANVMDVLHKKKIEIVSPTFMNQINANGKEFIPKMVKSRKVVAKKTPEDLIFDEANKSEEIEKKKDQLDNLKEQEELLHKEQKKLKKESDIKKNKESIEQIDKLKTKVEKSIEQNEEKSEK